MSLTKVAKVKASLAFAAGGLGVACSLLTNYAGISDGDPAAADATTEASNSATPPDAPYDAPYDGRLVKCGATACALDRGEVCCITTREKVTLGTVCAPSGQCPDAGGDGSIAVTAIACDEGSDCASVAGSVCCHKCGTGCGTGHRGIGVCAQPNGCLGAYDQIACDPNADAACPDGGRCTVVNDPIRTGVCIK